MRSYGRGECHVSGHEALNILVTGTELNRSGILGSVYLRATGKRHVVRAVDDIYIVDVGVNSVTVCTNRNNAVYTVASNGRIFDITSCMAPVPDVITSARKYIDTCGDSLVCNGVLYCNESISPNMYHYVCSSGKRVKRVDLRKWSTQINARLRCITAARDRYSAAGGKLSLPEYHGVPTDKRMVHGYGLLADDELGVLGDDLALVRHDVMLAVIHDTGVAVRRVSKTSRLKLRSGYVCQYRLGRVEVYNHQMRRIDDVCYPDDYGLCGAWPLTHAAADALGIVSKERINRCSVTKV